MRIPFKYTKELVIVTEHFSPSTGATAQLVTDLADDLHARGVNICILTSKGFDSALTRTVYVTT